MTVTVKILRNERQIPAGKLADAELHFSGAPLDGLKLIGFAVWRRRDGNGCVVTFPARPFNVHGGKTNFALLRAIDDPKAQDELRELVIRAFAEHEQHVAEVAS
jgi:hypothetical protein